MTRNRRPAVVLASIAAVLALGAGITGCENNSKGTGDAPVSRVNGHKGGDDSPANVTNFPDHFSNVATKCLAGAPGFRVTTNTSGRFEVTADPHC